MRAFVRLGQLLASNAELARRLDELERKYDVQLKAVFEAIFKAKLELEQKEPPMKGRFNFNV